jgi:hypothetical protein
MHKYAADGTVGLGAGRPYDPKRQPIYSHCSIRCHEGRWWWYERVRRCKPGAFCDLNVIPPDIRACIATCVAKEVAQH